MHVVQFNVMQQYKITLQNWTSMNMFVIISYIFVDLSHSSQMQYDVMSISRLIRLNKIEALINSHQIWLKYDSDMT